MVNKEKVDSMLLELGYADNLSGTEAIRRAACYYRPGMSMTKELYPYLAKAVDSTPGRIERAMRHATENAWLRGSVFVQEKYFGNTISPERGKPTNGELIARIVRACSEN